MKPAPPCNESTTFSWRLTDGCSLLWETSSIFLFKLRLHLYHLSASSPSPAPPCLLSLTSATTALPHISPAPGSPAVRAGAKPSSLVEFISSGSDSSRSWPPLGLLLLTIKVCLCCLRQCGHWGASMLPKADRDLRPCSLQPCHFTSGASAQITVSLYYSDLPVKIVALVLESVWGRCCTQINEHAHSQSGQLTRVGWWLNSVPETVCCLVILFASDLGIFACCHATPWDLAAFRPLLKCHLVI